MTKKRFFLRRPNRNSDRASPSPGWRPRTIPSPFPTSPCLQRRLRTRIGVHHSKSVTRPMTSIPRYAPSGWLPVSRQLTQWIVLEFLRDRACPKKIARACTPTFLRLSSHSASRFAILEQLSFVRSSFAALRGRSSLARRTWRQKTVLRFDFSRRRWLFRRTATQLFDELFDFFVFAAAATAGGGGGHFSFFALR